MPTNYKQSTVSGESWQRAARVIVENPYNAVPSVMFVEESVATLDGGKIIKEHVGNISIPFNPTATFPGLDPETNLPVGRDISHGEVYALLYSLYMHLTTERDGN